MKLSNSNTPVQLITLISELGGLHYALFLTGQFFVSILAVYDGRDISYLLATKLFLRPKAAVSAPNEDTDPITQSLYKIKQREPYAYRFNALCCLSTKESRMLRKGVNRIEKGLNVVNLLKL